MISTRRGLAILGVIALVLLWLVVADHGRRVFVVSRAVVPGLDVEHVTALRWEQDGTPVLSIAAQGEGKPWRFIAPAYGDVDASALANILATLRGARWHRRDGEHVAGAHARAIVITGVGQEHVVHFGRALEGGDQHWLVAGDHALLVDAWAARALDPGELALAVRRPFDGVDHLEDLTVGAVHLSGSPSTVAVYVDGPDSPPRNVVVAAPLADELRSAVAELEVTRLVALAAAATDSLHLLAGAVRGELGGDCPGTPGQTLLATSVVTGCVPAADADRVRAAVRALQRSAIEVAEPRPAPVAPTRITLPDGGVLELEKRALINGAPADPTRVAELLAVLSSPATLRDPGPPSMYPGTMSVHYGGRSLALFLLPGRQIMREREPVRLELTPAAWAILTRPSRALRDLEVWTEDPTTITTIAIDAVTYQRGAVVGEWTRTPAGPVDGPKVESLATQLAAVRAIAAEAPTFTPRHRVTITVTAPVGPPRTHELELGAATGQGCPARTNGGSVVLARGLCDAIAAHAK